jgi:hypothetical protein
VTEAKNGRHIQAAGVAACVLLPDRFRTVVAARRAGQLSAPRRVADPFAARVLKGLRSARSPVATLGVELFPHNANEEVA